jgi:hypothetical protein
MKISTKVRLVHELVNTLGELMYTKSLENKVFFMYFPPILFLNFICGICY